MNVKQGDLAYIVPPSVLNVGRVVEVVKPIWVIPGGWIVRTTGTPLDGINPHTMQPGSAFELGIHDDCLRPISGVPLNDTIDTENPIEEMA